MKAPIMVAYGEQIAELRESLERSETQLAERTRELSLARAHITRLELGIEPDESHAATRRELEAERATSHGLRLLNGANDAVHAQLVQERDEARSQLAAACDSLNKVSALAHETHVKLIEERDAARADVVRWASRWHDLERIQDRQLTADSLAMELAESESREREARAESARLRDERLVFKTGYEQHAGEVCCQPVAGEPALCGIRRPIRIVNDHPRWQPLVTCVGCRQALAKETT